MQQQVLIGFVDYFFQNSSSLSANCQFKFAFSEFPYDSSTFLVEYFSLIFTKYLRGNYIMEFFIRGKEGYRVQKLAIIPLLSSNFKLFSRNFHVLHELRHGILHASKGRKATYSE